MYYRGIAKKYYSYKAGFFQINEGVLIQIKTTTMKFEKNQTPDKKKGPKNILELLSTQVGKSHFIMDYRPLRHLNLGAKQHFMLIEILQWHLQGNKYEKAGSNAARDLGCRSEDGVYDVLKKLKKKNLVFGRKIPHYINGEPHGSKFIYEANLDEILMQILATPYFKEQMEINPEMLLPMETIMKKKLELKAIQSTPKGEDAFIKVRAEAFSQAPSIIEKNEEDTQKGLSPKEETILSEVCMGNDEQETQSSTFKSISHNDESFSGTEYPFVTEKIDPSKLLLRYIDAGENYKDLLRVLEEWGVDNNIRHLNIIRLNTFLTLVLNYDNLTESMTNDVKTIYNGIREDIMKLEKVNKTAGQ